MASVSVRIDRVNKNFGATPALRNVSLEIRPGELFFLLGPSGCGKSTLLRLIAGLHEPTSGRIFFNDRDVTHLSTEHRNAVMCFQSYALWPHMTVRENIRFGLAVRKLPRAEQEERIEQVLKLVQMKDYAARKPNALSGGQQQRVALARAIAVNPDCLLLDEPLSNLDAKLRQEMRSEIRRICKQSGATTIYVTHDQKEALSVADRIAVLRDGWLEQLGTPAELYYQPKTVFVADFIGQTNLIAGKIIAREGDVLRVETSVGVLIAQASGTSAESGDVTLSIRPEQLKVVPPDAAADGANRITGKAIENTFVGESSEHILAINDEQKLRVISTPPLLHVPEQLVVQCEPRDVVVLPR